MKVVKNIIYVLSAVFIFGGCTKAVKPDATNNSLANNNGYLEEIRWLDTTYADKSARSLASKKTTLMNDGEQCIVRIREAGCFLSIYDSNRIRNHVSTCKQMKSSNRKITLQILQFENTEPLVTIKTEGGQRTSKILNSRQTVQICPTSKYSVDPSGIDDIKAVGNQIFMNSNDGNVYFLSADERLQELLNIHGYPYRGVKGIQGSPDGNQVTLEDNRGNEIETLTPPEVLERKTRPIAFERYPSQINLFKD